MTATVNVNAHAIGNLVSAKPGICLSEVAEAIGIKINTVRHHVDRLARWGLVHKVPVRTSITLFTPDVPYKLRGIIGAMVGHDSRRDILERLAAAGQEGIGIGALMDATGREDRFIRWHLNILLDGGAVTGTKPPGAKYSCTPEGFAAVQWMSANGL